LPYLSGKLTAGSPKNGVENDSFSLASGEPGGLVFGGFTPYLKGDALLKNPSVLGTFVRLRRSKYL